MSEFHATAPAVANKHKSGGSEVHICGNETRDFGKKWRRGKAGNSAGNDEQSFYLGRLPINNSGGIHKLLGNEERLRKTGIFRVVKVRKTETHIHMNL
jgi:hypothetical protein